MNDGDIAKEARNTRARMCIVSPRTDMNIYRGRRERRGLMTGMKSGGEERNPARGSVPKLCFAAGLQN